MKYSFKLLLTLSLLLMSLFLTACEVGKQAESTANFIDIGNGERIAFHASYADVSIDEQIKEADIIFAGKITDISVTQWNQDNGKYWEEVVVDEIGETVYTATPFFTIKLLMDQPVFPDTKLNDSVVITVVGISPLEKISEDVENTLQVGNEVVIFARQSELTWREGSRPILQLMSEPQKSFFLLGDDGLYRTEQIEEKAVSLDELVERIAQKRDIQP